MWSYSEFMLLFGLACFGCGLWIGVILGAAQERGK